MTKTKTFFTKDPVFYKTLFRMTLILALQNLISYSVNMADNLMLGNYSQIALSGAATVNQVFFMIQQIVLALGNALVVLASQYWGENRLSPIRTLAGYTIKITGIIAVIIILMCNLMPDQILGIFSSSPEIIAEGKSYLSLVQWSFVLYMFSAMIMSVLRSVEIVNISFYISVTSLFVNVGINYVLIYGKFGMLEMGIRGAAIGTIIARFLECIILLIYVIKLDQKLHLFQKDFWINDQKLNKDYIHIMVPIMISQMIWAISVPLQTAILGHLSSDAIAANAISSTFFAYMKTVCLAMCSTSSVMIGMSIGRGDEDRIHSDARSIAVIDLMIGLVLGSLIVLLRKPLLLHYVLTPEALRLADHLFLIMGFTMVCMAYQMIVSVGLIQASGDGKFMVRLNVVCIWLIVIPLSFLSAFVWKMPIEAVAFMTQIDQPVKCIPVFLYFRSYKWVRKMTR